MGHQLRSLVQKVQQGQTVHNHVDMPQDIREQLRNISGRPVSENEAIRTTTPPMDTPYIFTTSYQVDLIHFSWFEYKNHT